MTTASITLDRQSENSRQHARLLGLLAAGARSQALLDTLVCGLEELMPGSLCSVLLMDRARGRLLHGSAPHLPSEYTQAVHCLAVGPASGSCGTAAYLGKTVIVPDISRDVRWSAYRSTAIRNGLQSCWSTPITSPDHSLLGTFAVYHPIVHQPSPDELSLALDFSDLAAVAIQHAALERAVFESEERFRRCFEQGPAGIAILDLDGRVIEVNRALARMLDREAPSLTGRALDTVIEPGDGALMRAAVQAVVTEPDTEQRMVARLGGAGQRIRQVSLAVARGPQGEPLCVCVNVSRVSASDEATDGARRAGAPASPHHNLPVSTSTRDRLDFGRLTIDPLAREVRRDDVLVELTRREFDLLWYLARFPRRVFTRDELLGEVWHSSREWQEEATVTQHVHRLRQRIEDVPTRPRWLLTVRGVGYRFDCPPHC